MSEGRETERQGRTGLAGPKIDQPWNRTWFFLWKPSLTAMNGNQLTVTHTKMGCVMERGLPNVSKPNVIMM